MIELVILDRVLRLRLDSQPQGATKNNAFCLALNKRDRLGTKRERTLQKMKQNNRKRKTEGERKREIARHSDRKREDKVVDTESTGASAAGR